MTKWYAATDEIVKMGPFETQQEAFDALKYADHMVKRTGRTRPLLSNVWSEQTGLKGWGL